MIMLSRHTSLLLKVLFFFSSILQKVMPKKAMPKKAVLFVLTAVFVLNLAACGDAEKLAAAKSNTAFQAHVVFSTNAATQEQLKSTKAKNITSKSQLQTLISPQKNTLIIYMPKHALQLQTALKIFSKETGIDVTLVAMGENDLALLNKLKKAGKNSLADVIVLRSSHALTTAVQADFLQSVHSEKLAKALHKKLREPENKWYGLAVNPRVLVYKQNTLTEADLAQLTSYADLANAAWRGRVCVSQSELPENVALVAALMRKHGEEKTLSILAGWQRNLAHAPFSNDTDLLKAVAAEQCRIGLVDYQHYLQFINATANKNQPKLATYFFAKTTKNQVNLIGAGVAKYATNPLKALTLLEWLAGEEAQIFLNADSQTQPVAKALLSKQVIQRLNKQQLNDSEKTQVKRNKKVPKRRKPPKKTKKSSEKSTQHTSENNMTAILARTEALLADHAAKEPSTLSKEEKVAAQKATAKVQALKKLSNSPMPSMAGQIATFTTKELTAAHLLMQKTNPKNKANLKKNLEAGSNP